MIMCAQPARKDMHVIAAAAENSTQKHNTQSNRPAEASVDHSSAHKHMDTHRRPLTFATRKSLSAQPVSTQFRGALRMNAKHAAP